MVDTYTDDAADRVAALPEGRWTVSISETWHRVYHGVLAATEAEAIERVREAENNGDADEAFGTGELEYVDTNDNDHMAWPED